MLLLCLPVQRSMLIDLLIFICESALNFRSEIASLVFQIDCPWVADIKPTGPKMYFKPSLCSFALPIVFVLCLALDHANSAWAQESRIKVEDRETVLQIPGLKGTVRVQLVPGTDILIVTGQYESDVIAVKQAIHKLMESAQVSRPRSRRVLMKNAHAEFVAVWAQHIYDKSYAQLRGPVEIVAYRQSEVLITGSKGAIEQAEELVKKMDHR